MLEKNMQPCGIITDKIAQKFTDLGLGFTQAEAICAQHCGSEAYHTPIPPQAVIFPTSTADVARILPICNEHRIPVIPHGAGTSLEGQLLATHGGLSLDLTGLNAMHGFFPEERKIIVGAGVTRTGLNEVFLRQTGLTFTVDPGADATIGGMIATNASGTTTPLYGSMRDNVYSLIAVLADGRIIKTRGDSRSPKWSAGLDLTSLFIGSEGTLGIVTEATLKLHAIPEKTVAIVMSFASVQEAIALVQEAYLWGQIAARAELLDTASIRAVNQFSKTDLPESPHLFIELHGTEDDIQSKINVYRDLSESYGATSLKISENPSVAKELWHARHNALWAAKALRPGSTALITDICVPVPFLNEAIERVQDILKDAPFPAPILGHVGDGNFHAFLIIDPNSETEITIAKALNKRIVQVALDMNGTITGEHGIGRGKKIYLEQQVGLEHIGIQRAIKNAVDPKGLLNPGAIFSLE